jgi:hypothetical protein
VGIVERGEWQKLAALFFIQSQLSRNNQQAPRVDSWSYSVQQRTEVCSGLPIIGAINRLLKSGPDVIPNRRLARADLGLEMSYQNGFAWRRNTGELAGWLPASTTAADDLKT